MREPKAVFCTETRMFPPLPTASSLEVFQEWRGRGGEMKLCCPEGTAPPYLSVAEGVVLFASSIDHKGLKGSTTIHEHEWSRLKSSIPIRIGDSHREMQCGF